MFNLLMTGLTGFNALSQSRSASKAASAQNALTAAEIARNEKLMELYADGSDEMRQVIEDLYASFGTRDDVSPEQQDFFESRFSLARQIEELQNNNKINSEEGRDLEFLFGTLGERRSDVDGFMPDDAASTYDMSPSVDRIAQKFINARMANAERAINTQYSKGLANVPEGLENSTLRVQLEKSAADLRAKSLNEALLAGTNDALNYAQGVQGLSKGEQGMALYYANSYVDNIDQLGRFGLAEYDAYNDTRTSAISDLANIYNLRNDTEFQDFIRGLDGMSKQSSVYNSYASDMATLAGRPYDFAATGAQNAGFGNALTANANMFDAYAKGASGSFESFGSYLNKLMNPSKPIS